MHADPIPPRLELDAIADKLEALLGSYPQVAAAYVFGSVARGKPRADSDLDVGVVFREPNMRDRNRFLLLGELGGRLEGLGGFASVDVVDLERQGPIFCHRALAEGRRIYEADRERRVDFESETYVRAFDFRPTYEIAARQYLRGFRRWLEERRR